MDFSKTRIYIDESVRSIYEELLFRSDRSCEQHPFETMKEIFMLAACLGASEGRYEELKVSHDIFLGSFFDTKSEIPILAALAYSKEKNLDVLEDPKRIVEIAQGYANGGIHIIRDKLLGNPGTPLFNFVSLLIDAEDANS